MFPFTIERITCHIMLQNYYYYFLPICYSWQTFKQNPMLDIHGFLVTQIELYNSHSEDSPRPCFWQQGFGVCKLWIGM